MLTGDKRVFSYSDGEEVETVAAAMKNVVISDVLCRAIATRVDWPSEYHLSPIRHNLLRPFSSIVTFATLNLAVVVAR
jgi:hypothetical protein